MKKVLAIAALLVTLMACNNPNPGESGDVNDGFEGTGDPSGGLPGDTLYSNKATGIDTAADDHRVDTWKRDSVKQ